MAKKKEELNLQKTKVEEKVKTPKIKEEKTNASTNLKSKKTTKKVEEKDTKAAAKLISKSTTKKESSSSKKVTSTSKTSSKAKTTTASKSTNTKTNSSKKASSSKPIKEKVTSNTEKVKEETIIEKIKSFIAKIVSMQEEARDEELAKKEKKKNAKKAKKTIIDLENPVYLPEYYDLPYRYNETVVKILAQTPKRIFVYWDVADEDKIRYEKAFGNDFYEKTYPVLLVHNDDKNYTTEIPINDFANSWYINIKDSKSKYTIQLGRKFKTIPTNLDIVKLQEQNIVLRTDYLPIAQSNILEVPNDRVLFNEMPSKIVYRNVKTYEEKEKVISEIKTPFGVLYNLKEFYEENYKDEMIDEEIFHLNNPTSGGLSSSSFK